MTSAEIRTLIRRAIREPKVKDLSNVIIDVVVLNGVTILGNEIKRVAPSFFNKRVSLASDSHVFAWPSDCVTVLNVRDLMTTAKDITGATNVSPIVITSADHGFEDDAVIVVHDVGGNTAANGTWKVANEADDTLELYGSTGDGAYTSGGKMFQESSTFTRIIKANPGTIALGDKTVWYPRGRNIVIGNYSFTNDILIEYASAPTAITDIPSEYHMGLVAFAVTTLLTLPDEGAKNFTALQKSLEAHTIMWSLTIKQIRGGLRASIEPTPISQSVNWDDGFDQ